MNFLNSILMFFAVLLLGPTLISFTSNPSSHNVQYEFFKDDPYEGTILVHGGTFAMGMNQESIMSEWNNSLRRVTVSSFRIDKYEVSNKKYRDYTHWLEKVFLPLKKDSIVKAALPDTLVWKSDLAYNEPMIEGYFRSKAFDDYPVVGVTWEQANNYCRWRTDRENEKILIHNGIIDPKSPYINKYNLVQSNQLDSSFNRLNKNNTNRPKTELAMIPDFRLPTEAEWEYAAKVSSGKNYISNFNNPKAGPKSSHPNASIVASDSPYPWSSNGNEGLRNTTKNKQGMFMANFKNGSGDYMGMTGYTNDGAGFPAKVTSFLQTSLGLYNMSGNVNEWVADIYRPLNSVDMDDFNPYRGNNSLDGDDTENASYESGINTLISNKSRVYKGGSWKDRPYWLNPGTRRFMDQDKSSNTIGFRCASSAFGFDIPSSDDNKPKFPYNLFKK